VHESGKSVAASVAKRFGARKHSSKRAEQFHRVSFETGMEIAGLFVREVHCA
jgi:hypothetical protein